MWWLFLLKNKKTKEEEGNSTRSRTFLHVFRVSLVPLYVSFLLSQALTGSKIHLEIVSENLQYKWNVPTLTLEEFIGLKVSKNRVRYPSFMSFQMQLRQIGTISVRNRLEKRNGQIIKPSSSFDGSPANGFAVEIMLEDLQDLEDPILPLWFKKLRLWPSPTILQVQCLSFVGI